MLKAASMTHLRSASNSVVSVDGGDSAAALDGDSAAVALDVVDECGLDQKDEFEEEAREASS